MATLARDLRKDLEKTVKQARRVAETGARKVLEQLGVHHHEPYRSMSPEQRLLRNRLRAHGRQLGDRRDRQKGTQTIDRLIQECAYEHWHRMLFARFLAETDLLIEPQSGVAITLEECQELAREEDADWLALASDYAERMLPQIFRTDDLVLAVTLPPEARSELEDLLKALPRDVFVADDSLGWVYQFWQAEKKEEVNRSETKIGADELPAVTQLFTEDYMVLFLLHNTLGAWWAGKVLAGNPALASSARSENELRAACKVGDFEWTYLRFIRDKEDNEAKGPWRPAAGTFEDWPKAAKDLTLLDPCMGSGHFLVFALPILVAFRMAEEGLSETAAVDAVLRNNLFGLEIDPRCTQLAAFNLAFAAWRRTGFHALPALNIACSGLAIGVTKAEWLKLAEKAVVAADPYARRDLLGVEDTLFTHGVEERVKNGLEALYDLFGKAPWLGSLIDPRQARADIFQEGFDKLEPLLMSILSTVDNDETREIAVTARGVTRAADFLSRHFSLLVTNVPFLTQLKFSGQIHEFVSRNYWIGRANLATAFMIRMRYLLSDNGSMAFVAPQSWWFLKRYKGVRESFLKKSSLLMLLRLGENAFESPQAGGELVGLTICSESKPLNNSAFRTLDVSGSPDAFGKATDTGTGTLKSVLQAPQLENLDSAILFEDTEALNRLEAYATALRGVGTGDGVRFIRYFWEVSELGDDWEAQQTTASRTCDFGGMNEIILWEKEQGALAQFANAVKELNHAAQNWRRGKPNWGKRGVVVSQMGDLAGSLYLGSIYDPNCCAIVPDNSNHVPAIWAMCHSGELFRGVRKINQNRKVEVRTILSVPFDLSYWKKAAEDQFPQGLPKPFSSDPTQWIFSGHLYDSSSPLQTSLARLLGFRWPRQTGSNFMDCPAVGPDGLEGHADDDGIVCLTALKGEAPIEQRLNAVLADACRTGWTAARLAGLLVEAGFAGKSLDEWLRDGFFEQHCALFQKRPFIWHIWDGRRNGFHALVNYHRLAAPDGEGRRTLEKLIYSYLGDWIDRQRADQKVGVEGADARLGHADHLRAELVKILKGEPPYDIFIRWKPLHQQPIGWEPDINDGVRINIRPFAAARPLSARAKNACILRSTPKIKWQKDRGKEPMRDKEDYPWFWGWDEETPDFAGNDKFDGNRWNDLHYSNAFKQAARERRMAEVEGNA